MSLTSYRAAPPRGGGCLGGVCWSALSRIAVGPGGPGRPGVATLGGWRAGRFGEPGGDLLFRVFRRSTIGAEGFHGRVRDGIGCLAPRCGHQAGQTSMKPRARLRTVLAEWSPRT